MKTRRKLLESLLQEFDGRCAYCGSKLGVTSRPEIEEYYPKTRYPERATDPTNLLVACSACNAAKGAKFPVDPQGTPLLLNPRFDDYSKHLAQEPSGLVTALTRRGGVTIETCQLNRPALVERRKADHSQREKRALFRSSAGRCAFPGCTTPTTLDGRPIAEIVHILSAAPGGPRFDPDLDAPGRASSEENLILLCPSHHRLVDSDPATYTAAYLRELKARHEEEIARVSSADELPEPAVDPGQLTAVSEAVAFWDAHKTNAGEEFWQRFFAGNPWVIAQAVPDHVLLLEQKCYVGGKRLDNKGGNIVDYVYVNKHLNVTLVELKTPATKLVGAEYRQNAHSMSEELTGAVVQVLNYRHELMVNYHSFAHTTAGDTFQVFNPQCLVVAGSLEAADLSEVERRSFELFRSNLGPLKVITFDELFGKIQDLSDLLSDEHSA